MKDLASPRYWTLFGEIGQGMGRSMPTPQEAADTVLALMRERDALRAQVVAAERRTAAVLATTDTLCLFVANKADEVRALAREAAQTTREAGE